MVVTSIPGAAYGQSKADSAAADSVASAAISANAPGVIANGKQVPVVTGQTQMIQLGPGQSVRVRVETKGDSALSGVSSQQAQQMVQQLMVQMGSGSRQLKAGANGQFQIIMGTGTGNGAALPAPQIKTDAPPQIKADSTTATPSDSAAAPSK